MAARADEPVVDRRTSPLRVALLGCGVVGTQVARLLTTHADDLAARVGRRSSWSASPSGAPAATARRPRVDRRAVHHRRRGPGHAAPTSSSR